MRLDRRRAATAALAVVAGTIPGFFLVFAGVFTDAPTGLLHPERLMSFGLVALAFALLGAAFGWLDPRAGAWPGLWLGAASIAILALYTFREPAGWFLHVVYLGLAVGSGAAAAAAASRRRRGRVREA